MIKLGDLYLSELEARALRRLLDQYITQEDRDKEAAEEAENSARSARWWTALARIARDTARQDGITTFWRHGQIQASWEAFCANESYHSTFDVDEHFQPDDDWRETWEMHYHSELEAMQREAEAGGLPS